MPVSHSHQFLWVSRRPIEAGQQHRIGGVGDVPDFMALAAEHAQHVDLGGIALGQRLAVAYPHHLGAAALVVPFRAGDVLEVFRIGRIGHVDDRGAVELGLAGHLVDRLGHVVGAAVMADIGDVAVALLVDGGLIGAAGLQVVIADQPHVHRLGRIADLLLLRQSRRRQQGRSSQSERHRRPTQWSSLHVKSSLRLGPRNLPGMRPILSTTPGLGETESGRPVHRRRQNG